MLRQAIVDGQRLLLLVMMACQTLQNGRLHRTHVMLQQLRTEHFEEWVAAAQKAKCVQHSMSFCHRVVDICPRYFHVSSN